MTRVLVTGASGFIGSALVAALSRAGMRVRGAYRNAVPAVLDNEAIIVGDLSGVTNWSPALADVDAVVHAAGPAHAKFTEPALHTQIVEATVALAAQAEAAGLRRIVYLSSIKAACDSTDVPIDEAAAPRPVDAYGRSKLAAEAAIAMHPNLRPVALRPPLVIAANAKANFARLMKVAASGVPLPLAGISNRRSLLSLDSLMAAVAAILSQQDGPTGVFHLADRPALSTPEIVAALCEGMGRRLPLMFPAPKALLPVALTESLEVDDTRFRAAYGEAWSRDARAAVVACGKQYR